MKIKQIVCENVKNIPNGTYMLPQNITVVSGANGSGKTTLLDLIQYILNGGKAPDRLVKNGTKKAIFKHRYTLYIHKGINFYRVQLNRTVYIHRLLNMCNKEDKTF